MGVNAVVTDLASVVTTPSPAPAAAAPPAPGPVVGFAEVVAEAMDARSELLVDPGAVGAVAGSGWSPLPMAVDAAASGKLPPEAGKALPLHPLPELPFITPLEGATETSGEDPEDVAEGQDQGGSIGLVAPWMAVPQTGLAATVVTTPASERAATATLTALVPEAGAREATAADIAAPATPAATDASARPAPTVGPASTDPAWATVLTRASALVRPAAVGDEGGEPVLAPVSVLDSSPPGTSSNSDSANPISLTGLQLNTTDTSRPGLLTLSLDSKPGSEPWLRELGQHVVWQAASDIQHARIRLNPVDLGPLDVEVRVSDSGTEVHFIAAHAATREALEQGLGRLREHLDAAGLNLSAASVGDGQQGRDPREGAASRQPQPPVYFQDKPRAQGDGAPAGRIRIGLIDEYA